MFWIQRSLYSGGTWALVLFFLENVLLQKMSMQCSRFLKTVIPGLQEHMSALGTACAPSVLDPCACSLCWDKGSRGSFGFLELLLCSTSSTLVLFYAEASGSPSLLWACDIPPPDRNMVYKPSSEIWGNERSHLMWCFLSFRSHRHFRRKCFGTFCAGFSCLSWEEGSLAGITN